MDSEVVVPQSLVLPSRASCPHLSTNYQALDKAGDMSASIANLIVILMSAVASAVVAPGGPGSTDGNARFVPIPGPAPAPPRFAALAAVPLSAQPVVYVSVDGNDDGKCGSAAAPCASLRYAVAVAEKETTEGWTAMLGPGLYDNRSCAVVTSRPLAVIGSGSATTTVDCQETSRMLSSTGPSVSMQGLTVMNGFETQDADSGVGDGYGGGAVSVVWNGFPIAGNVAVFTDVRFVKNSFVSFDGSGGGGAVSISSGDADSPSTASGVVVCFRNCEFLHNVLNCTGDCCACYSYGGDGGGGVYVNFYDNATSTTISFVNVTAKNNSAGRLRRPWCCNGCQGPYLRAR